MGRGVMEAPFAWFESSLQKYLQKGTQGSGSEEADTGHTLVCGLAHSGQIAKLAGGDFEEGLNACSLGRFQGGFCLNGSGDSLRQALSR